MAYKPRIESNNLDLTSILSTINELPEAGGSGNEGIYGWIKSSGQATQLAFPTLVNCTISGSTQFSVTTGSGANNWNVRYVISEMINCVTDPITVTFTPNADTLLTKDFFISFADIETGQFSQADYALRCVKGGLEFWENGAQKASSFANYAVGDTVKCVIKQGELNIYVNNVLVKSVVHSLENVFVAILPFDANTTYGMFTAQYGSGTNLGFVVSNEANAYPEDGTHTDGFYYTSLNTVYDIIDTLTGDV